MVEHPSFHLLSDCNLNKNTQKHGPSGRAAISYTYGISTRIMTAALLNFFPMKSGENGETSVNL